jgi:hypothetical protein
VQSCLTCFSVSSLGLYPEAGFSLLYGSSAIYARAELNKHQSSNKYEYTIYNGPTNALVCIKTLIQISQTKTFKITPTCFDHQIIIIRELFDPG